jgi:hypothetical protein
MSDTYFVNCHHFSNTRTINGLIHVGNTDECQASVCLSVCQYSTVFDNTSSHPRKPLDILFEFFRIHALGVRVSGFRQSGLSCVTSFSERPVSWFTIWRHTSWIQSKGFSLPRCLFATQPYYWLINQNIYQLGMTDLPILLWLSLDLLFYVR